MKIALHGGLITLIIMVFVGLLNFFRETNYIGGQYDVFILYYVIINSLYLEKLVSKSNTKTN